MNSERSRLALALYFLAFALGVLWAVVKLIVFIIKLVS